MGFPRQESWSGLLPFPSPGDLLDPGVEPASPAWQVDSLPLNHLGSQGACRKGLQTGGSRLSLAAHSVLLRPPFPPPRASVALSLLSARSAGPGHPLRMKTLILPSFGSCCSSMTTSELSYPQNSGVCQPPWVIQHVATLFARSLSPWEFSVVLVSDQQGPGSAKKSQMGRGRYHCPCRADFLKKNHWFCCWLNCAAPWQGT